MSSFLWHTIADTSANLLAVTDSDMHDLYKARHNWSYQQRGPGAIVNPGLWRTLWPQPRAMSGAPDVCDNIFGQDIADGGLYEPISVTDSGCSRPYFVMGRCVDASGNALAAVNLDIYLTAGHVYVASGITDQNGYYQLPTSYAAQAHTIYANYASGTYVGASVSTLTPNF